MHGRRPFFVDVPVEQCTAGRAAAALVHGKRPLFEIVPAGQCGNEWAGAALVHGRCPFFEVVPRGHLLQTAAVELEYASAVQLVHLGAPAVENVPAVQLVHLGAPEAENVPAVQFVQCAAPGRENVPAVQLLQARAPGPENVPKGQGAQTSKNDEYVPAGHGTHVTSGPRNVPTGQYSEGSAAASPRWRESADVAKHASVNTQSTTTRAENMRKTPLDNSSETRSRTSQKGQRSRESPFDPGGRAFQVFSTLKRYLPAQETCSSAPYAKKMLT